MLPHAPPWCRPRALRRVAIRRVSIRLMTAPTPAPARPAPAPDAGPLAYRPYRRYWLARIANTVAMQIQVVAVGWQIYLLTDSPLALGLVGLAQFAPRLALTFVSGPVVDRYDRRRIIAVCRLIQALATLSIAALSHGGWATPTQLYVYVAVMGLAQAFDMPATQALVPSLVPPSVLSRAIALASSAGQAATIAGPALGGALYAGGPALAYGSSAALFLIACLLILRVQVARATRAKAAWSMAYLFAGVRYIREHPVVLGAISLDMFAVLLGGATALLPIYAKDILHTGPWGLGLLRSAPAIGALVVALWLAHTPLQRRVGRLLLGAVAVFGLATLVFGLSRSLPWSIGALIVLGGADMISVVIRLSLVQIETPDEMRGRVSAVNSLFVGASNQIGEFESGALAAAFGAVPAVLIGGVGTLIVVALWWRWFPALAQRDRLTEPVPSVPSVPSGPATPPAKGI